MCLDTRISKHASAPFSNAEDTRFSANQSLKSLLVGISDSLGNRVKYRAHCFNPSESFDFLRQHLAFLAVSSSSAPRRQRIDQRKSLCQRILQSRSLRCLHKEPIRGSLCNTSGLEKDVIVQLGMEAHGPRRTVSKCPSLRMCDSPRTLEKATSGRRR
ncbi:hypothetical protein EUGRSUZ_G01438 [Eucalyptus grandis]|uniref:Uncharacterized protein n=2 Tax=Eucalyptus grandis TaxID=71139 RepID=A0ACC3K289_EUCGR|nr:hypothetical protein EUGRSUZ_G01438 [Eucalyptus grandis]